MTPAARTKSILVSEIKNIQNVGVDHIHTFFIGNDDMDTEPILLITEAPDYSSDSGNDQIIMSKKRIQIEFYYPKNYEFDMSAIERSVKAVLQKYRFYCNSDAGHVITPDTENITNTLKFIYNEEEI
ncbi:DUF806 family protein [Paucilactobacillus sp. N302-9]